eukprot:6214530-Pleurochrysis_carterae.AAC.3
MFGQGRVRDDNLGPAVVEQRRHERTAYLENSAGRTVSSVPYASNGIAFFLKRAASRTPSFTRSRMVCFARATTPLSQEKHTLKRHLQPLPSNDSNRQPSERSTR